MRTFCACWAVGLALWCLVAGGDLAAQTPDRIREFPPGTTTAAEASKALREKGTPGFSLRTLRQVGHAFPAHELDALADTLVAFIVRSVASGTNDGAVSEARRALGLSGVSAGDGTPYAGAGRRLLRIIEGTPASYPAGELFYLGQLADKQEAVRLLSSLARSELEIAERAIGMLLRDLGPEGEVAVERIFLQGEARSPGARRVLQGVATTRGWASPRRP